jgi:hypothetical protein
MTNRDEYILLALIIASSMLIGASITLLFTTG